MSKAERTKQFIIEKSAPIFNQKGFEGTSLSDIENVTNLSRGAIYRNFADKNELAVLVFKHNLHLSQERVKNAMTDSTSSAEALLKYASYYSKNWQDVLIREGCPMQNAAIEADDHLPFMRNYVRTGISNFIHMLRDIIEEGKKKQEFHQDIDSLKYSALFFSIVEGNIMLAKIMNDPKYLEEASQRIHLIILSELVK